MYMISMTWIPEGQHYIMLGWVGFYLILFGIKIIDNMIRL